MPPDPISFEDYLQETKDLNRGTNPFYNIGIPPCEGSINYSEVESLPEFGANLGMLKVGYRALFVERRFTQEKLLEYVRATLLAPIVETEKMNGMYFFILYMVPVVMDV